MTTRVLSRVKAIFSRHKSYSPEEKLTINKEHRLAERYRVLIEYAPVCIHEIDKNGTLTAVNRAGMKMMGRTESIIGVPALTVVSPPERLRITRLLELAFAGEFVEFEFCGARERTFLSCFMPLKNKDGSVRKVLGISQDITHRKNAEKRLCEALKMDALGKLAAGIAHDFSNTLNVIVACAELIQQVPEKTMEYTTEILNATQQGTALARRMLSFSHSQPINPHAVNLNRVIESTVKMLQRLVGKDIELAVHVDDNLPAITAEDGQTEQIIFNLVVNAADAMPGGGHLTISTSSSQVDDAEGHRLGVAPGPYTVLKVSDEGHGMTAETVARIFEPFFTTKAAGEGTGLGLATVHAIVKQAGGHIAVDSRIGEGTMFTVYFPAVEAQVAAVA